MTGSILSILRQPPGNHYHLRTSRQMLNIAILALDNCIHSTVSGPFDIFSIAAMHSRESDNDNGGFCSVQIVLPDENPVHSFNGLIIDGTKTTKDTERYDLIMTPALMGDLSPLLENSEVIDWIIDQHEEGACICSVCAGAFLVAKAGLLNGKQATTHWALADDFKSKFPEVNLKIEKMLVDEGDIISAGGVTAYLDLCIYIINRFGTPELASSISKTLLIDTTRQTQTPYSSYTFRKSHGDEAVLKAQTHLEKMCKSPVKIPDLAAVAGLEERTFNRRFKKATGETPTEYIQGLRIENARKLLETTQEPVDRVTQAVGYEDVSSFRRLFKQHTGLSPSDYRKRFSVFYRGEHN